MFSYMKTISYLYTMKKERKIQAFGSYFQDFISSIGDDVKKKVFYVLDMLKTGEMISEKFVKKLRDDIYELRVKVGSNIYRVFFIFDKGNIVVLFHGFQKKTQKTPKVEIEKAIRLKNEYYEQKRNC